MPFQLPVSPGRLTLVVAVVRDAELPHGAQEEEERRAARRQRDGLAQRPRDVAAVRSRERREQDAAQQLADEDAEEERGDVQAQVPEAEECVPALAAGGEDEVVGEGRGLHVV